MSIARQLLRIWLDNWRPYSINQSRIPDLCQGGPGQGQLWFIDL